VLPPSLRSAPPSGRVRARGTSHPTTLHAATGVSVVHPPPKANEKKLVLAAAGTLAVAGAILFAALRPTHAPDAPPPATATAAAATTTATATATKSDSIAARVAQPVPQPDSKGDFVDESVRKQTIDRDTNVAKSKVDAKPNRVAEARTPPARTGRLTIGCRAVPCTVSIDGGPAIRSPIRGLELAAGRHQIAIANRELGIDDRFSVEVRAGAAQTILKEYETKKPEPPPEPKPEPKPDAKPRDKTLNPFAKPSGS
jgi:hypothetical protein